MSGDPPGSTPLDTDEAAELIPEHLATRADLNAWEQANIASAVEWLARRRRTRTVLGQEFLRELHSRMFDRTWRWAGKFRVTGKNLGVPADAIPQRLRDLLDDARHWKEHATFSRDELAVRFHHRLVQIHPFPNGNGRLGRLATDALMDELGGTPFTWGAVSIDVEGDVRERYLAALRRADGGDIGPLLAFVRS